MVANYRCNEMKEEAMVAVKPQVEKLLVESGSKVLDGFGERCAQVVATASEMFRDAAKQYNREVFEKVLAELKEQLLSQLYHCFDSQLKKIRQYTYDKVVGEIKKL